jgi:hypothetical protein
MGTDMRGRTTMAERSSSGAGRGRSRWRIAGWAGAALVVLVPLVAMQFTDEVQWSAADFAFAAALILAVGIPFELALRKTGDSAYRAAAGLALAAAFLLVWVNGAVGIIGSEEKDANLMYGGVLAVGLIGAAIARFEAQGTARALFTTALAQALVAAIALGAGLGSPESGALELAALNGFFVILFVGSGLLFRKAASGRRHPSA